MRHIKTYALFEGWKPKFTEAEIFYAIPWQENNRDLYPGYSPEGDTMDASDEYWFDSKEDAERYAADLIDLFDSLPDPVPVYRALKAKSEADIDLEMPGESWSFDRDSAVNFGRHNGSNFLLTAKVSKKDVNWAGTIKAYVLFSGSYSQDDENELVVDDQDKLQDIKVEPMRGKK